MTATARPRRRRFRKRWILLAAFALLLLLFFAAAVSDKQGPAVDSPGAIALPPDQPKLVFTYFYYWYDLPDGPHSDALTQHPAAANTSYEDVSWFRGQLVDMAAAGIDVSLAVYWGDEEPSSDPGLANMVAAARALRAEGGAPPRIGLFLDTGLIGRWDKDDRDLRKPENQARVYELIKRFYTIVPREQWAIVDGRPPFWLWGSWLDIRFDQSFFDYINAQFEQDFGSRLYVVADNSWRYATESKLLGGARVDRSQPIRVDDFYSWGASLEGYREEGGNIAQIGPGYDERQLESRDRTGRFRDREDGDFYRRSWEAAIASGKRFVAIETWNEFHEAAAIAESQEYGRSYIDITRQLAQRFKARS